MRFHPDCLNAVAEGYPTLAKVWIESGAVAERLRIHGRRSGRSPLASRDARQKHEKDQRQEPARNFRDRPKGGCA